MDKTLLAILPVFVGAAIAAGAGLFGAWIQGRREHARWVRERRYLAFEKAYSLTTRVMSLLDELDAFAVHEVDPAKQAEREDLRARAKKLGEDMVDASTPFVVLGPKSVDDHLGRLVSSKTSEDRQAANLALIGAMRKSLKIKG